MRSSGVLLHISSLPSKYGIGTFGKEAYNFVDFLKSSGQRYWQILPIGPVSYHDSPYQSFSTFAGNPYFIDFDILCDENILEKSDYENMIWYDSTDYVDYGIIYKNRFKVLKTAFKNGYNKFADKILLFVNKNLNWLPDYALYMSLKNHFNNLPFTKWDLDIRQRSSSALTRYKELLKEDIEFHYFVQFMFFEQWNKLKKYANDNGIKIIGDLPIYVAEDSSDVWANPEIFQLDEKRIPVKVAGVPPDDFSAEGQLWGNPLYRWDILKKTGYKWWIERISSAINLFDITRIDHFRGFEAYFSIDYGEKTAKHGEWIKGPGNDFITLINQWFPDAEFIAEDLGFLTEGVRSLLKISKYPGMKVLLFGFEAYGDSDYLPYKYEKNSVAYIGTHDNDTVNGWMKSASPENIKYAGDYMRLNKKEGYHWGMIKTLMSSNSDLVIIQMQDILGLGNEARMNTPSVIENNWRWRLNHRLNKNLSKKLFEITKRYMRI